MIPTLNCKRYCAEEEETHGLDWSFTAALPICHQLVKTPSAQEAPMRVAQALLATSVALIACTSDRAAATEAGTKMKTPTAPAAVSDASASASSESDVEDAVFVYNAVHVRQRHWVHGRYH
jgi:hypothetical protein